MANLTERRDRSGKLISYSIRVHRGRGADGKQLKPWTATFKVKPTWKEETARKKAEDFARDFEKGCREGSSTDCRTKFAAYCDYVISMKAQRGKLKPSTVFRYKEMTKRIYPVIGHLKLKDIRVDHLNDLYSELLKTPSKKEYGTMQLDVADVLKEKRLNRREVAKNAGVGINAVIRAFKGEQVTRVTAESICDVLGLNIERVFTSHPEIISPKTVIEHHRLISTVLRQAEREGLIPFNVAARAEPPNLPETEPNYFQPEQIAAIWEALEKEPIRLRTLVHLLIITGARRGEILGLKWSSVDFNNNQIHICNNIQYTKEQGIFESTPKTKNSDRFIVLPDETMKLLKSYKAWQASERLRLGEYYENHDYVFCKDNGSPFFPGIVNNWLNQFSKRHGLPHINPHAFRHTMASILIYNRMDIVSVSSRLGHSKTSITENIYGHAIKEADKKNADILADVFLKKA